jgi:tetratricopeptide (TPR) repeat protein
MYFDLGRLEDAEARYRSAVVAGIDGPPQYLPFSYLRIGNLLDLRGERRSAKTFYRKALSEAGEHAWVRRAAKHYLDEPYTGSPGGFPPL